MRDIPGQISVIATRVFPVEVARAAVPGGEIRHRRSLRP